MNVVLDTNIAIGAAITPKGPPAEIIRAWRASSFTWVTSNALLDELARVFAYPRVKRYLTWDDSQIQEFFELIHRVAQVTTPDDKLDVVRRDADDNRVLEAALAGDAQYVVTNDNDLLDLKVFRGIEIVTAAHFAALLSQTRQ